MRQVFRRILAREVGTSGGAAAVGAATRRLCEHFARRMTPLVGDAGAAAIYTRSLFLAQRFYASPAAVHAPATDADVFARIEDFLAHREPAEGMDAASMILGGSGDLLAAFIGQGLTDRLLRDGWGDEFAAVARLPQDIGRAPLEQDGGA